MSTYLALSGAPGQIRRPRKTSAKHHLSTPQPTTTIAKNLETNPTVTNTAKTPKHLSNRPPPERRSCRTGEVQAPKRQPNLLQHQHSHLVVTTTQHHLQQHPTASTTPPPPKQSKPPPPRTATTHHHHHQGTWRTALATTTTTENREHLNKAKTKTPKHETTTIAVPASCITPNATKAAAADLQPSEKEKPETRSKSGKVMRSRGARRTTHR
ncbi:hypothetical protein QL285_056972 [Trifolium repens]|nr:hypothetical protein QL285_056972 [Trifolium repens]